MKEFIRRLFGRPRAAVSGLLEAQLDAFLVSQFIGAAIVSRRPFLASRLGFTEAQCLTQPGGLDHPAPAILERIWRFSGVFPATGEQFREFGTRYLAGLGFADLLGLIRTSTEARLVKLYAPAAARCDLGALEPFLYAYPWSQYLEGRRVLVVHPFAHSIMTQYCERREMLFFDPRVLPIFDLRVIKSPQTIAGNTDGFSSWSVALAHLFQEVERKDFDVAIVGCGAYGLPLGAHIKSLGKVAIHLGGATQLLFGVSGKRWRDNPAFRSIMNNSWVSPLESERPPDWEKVENGCYW